MGAKTGIEWTDSTWNPFMGCSRVSKGCRHCYAERIAGRFSAKTEGVYAGTTKAVEGLQVWTGKLNSAREVWTAKLNSAREVWTAKLNSAREQTWELPLRWKKPRRVFVNSMSDLFHENAPLKWVDRAFATMALAPRHVFQILTKRPERMLDYLTLAGTKANIHAELTGIKLSRREFDHLPFEPPAWPLPNVWLGVSVENQRAADERIPLLLKTPAAMRFVSCEPLLGPISLDRWSGEALKCMWPGCGWWGPTGEACRDESNPDGSRTLCPCCGETCPPAALLGEALHWVICGGESGPNARAMNPDWARSLRDQCVVAGVPYFFKQWGEWMPSLAEPVRGEHTSVRIFLRPDGFLGQQGDWWHGKAAAMDRVGKKAAGALLDGREWKQFPQEIPVIARWR